MRSTEWRKAIVPASSAAEYEKLAERHFDLPLGSYKDLKQQVVNAAGGGKPKPSEPEKQRVPLSMCKFCSTYACGFHDTNPDLVSVKELYPKQLLSEDFLNDEQARKGKTPSKDHKKKYYPEKEHEHHSRLKPKPCFHPGMTCAQAGAEKCSCAKQLVFCDKNCICEEDCNQRYEGCQCKDGCTEGKCTCLSYNRECDLSVCHKGEPDFVLVEEKADACCKNCDMQRPEFKECRRDNSTAKGFGCYVVEPVQKREFIGEYVGEIIKQ